MILYSQLIPSFPPQQWAPMTTAVRAPQTPKIIILIIIHNQVSLQYHFPFSQFPRFPLQPADRPVNSDRSVPFPQSAYSPVPPPPQSADRPVQSAVWPVPGADSAAGGVLAAGGAAQQGLRPPRDRAGQPAAPARRAQTGELRLGGGCGWGVLRLGEG